MLKNKLLALSLSFLLVTPFFALAEESITITTYYPSPYGSYNDLYVANRLGIGTTGPGAKLEIYDGSTQQTRLHLGGSDSVPFLASGNDMNGSGYGWGMFYDSSGNFALRRRLGSSSYTSPPVLYAQRADGNVGIGTTSPGAKLDVAGGIKLANDTAACTSSNAGTMRWTGTDLQLCKDNSWKKIKIITSINATGGTITEVGGYRIHTFTSNGTFTVDGDGTVEVLVVAGGGSGGGRHGGGGGGGGVIRIPSATVTSGSYTVIVGAGGGTSTTCAVGAKGSNSFFGIGGTGETAIGGGGGGAYGSSIQGQTGGSGGGGASTGDAAGGSASQPVTNAFGAATGYASVGGMGKGECPSDVRHAGGGGGATQTGGSGACTGIAGKGGDGVLINIDGNNYYYGGGGGGSEWVPAGGAGAGGLGGGGGGGFADYACINGNYGLGGGSARNSGQNGYHGAPGTGGHGGAGGANTGGGGGGSGQACWSCYSGYGGAGGSGIVIIRYPI